MSIAAANVDWNYLLLPRLVAQDLLHLQEPCVILEHKSTDSDGVDAYWYSVGGWLDGRRLARGHTLDGQPILVHAPDRAAADDLACCGLHDTILELEKEGRRTRDANAALARLSSVSPLERIDQATKPDSDKSDAFIDDLAKVRPLIGDDVILAAGRVH